MRPDVGRLGMAGAQPNIDSRALSEYGAIVSTPTSDAGGSYVARVHLLHSDTEVTAAISQAWAGVGHGTFFPPEVDDKVLCTPVLGHPDAGWIVTARFWEPSTPAPAETQQRADALILAPSGKTVRVAVQGDGDVILEARGGGLIKLGLDTADDPVALKSDWTAWLHGLAAAITALNALPPGPPVTAALLALNTLQTALGNLFPSCALKVVAV